MRTPALEEIFVAYMQSNGDEQYANSTARVRPENVA
jgi:hypothetical protein